VAGADLLAGVIEWRGPFRYMMTFWDENISAPIGTIAKFLFSSLHWPEPPELAVDYATLALLLAGSFLRMRRLMHPVESLQQSKRSLKELRPAIREVDQSKIERAELPAGDKRASVATPDLVVVGPKPDKVVLGTRSAGAFEAIDRAFAPMNARSFAAILILSTLFWPLSALVLFFCLTRDLGGWIALKWGAPTQAISAVASRALWSRDPELMIFTRAQLLARWQRFMLALAPFLLFVLLFVANQALAPVPPIEVIIAIAAIPLAALGAFLWSIARRHPNDDVAEALERAERTLRKKPYTNRKEPGSVE